MSGFGGGFATRRGGALVITANVERPTFNVQ
jgi:hypothetical protein